MEDASVILQTFGKEAISLDFFYLAFDINAHIKINVIVRCFVDDINLCTSFGSI